MPGALGRALPAFGLAWMLHDRVAQQAGWLTVAGFTGFTPLILPAWTWVTLTAEVLSAGRTCGVGEG